jgi:site-specific recombinase XerD
LLGSLLYGAGLRLREALTLRVKDVQFEYRQLMIRGGKGGKDRSAILPEALVVPLQQHLVTIQARHDVAIQKGFAGVSSFGVMEPAGFRHIGARQFSA